MIIYRDRPRSGAPLDWISDGFYNLHVDEGVKQ
jgi:hypothetical protein